MPSGPAKGTVAPDRVAAPRYFHLDNLGAQTRQGHAEVGAGQEYGHGQHPYIAQWLHRKYHAFYDLVTVRPV